jgi:uncharacterized protein (TIGR00730 family)
LLSLAENGLKAMNKPRALRRVCVFCGSSKGTNPAHLAAAQEAGRELARRGLALVYGGGNVGLMGALADAALSVGGHVIGVIPEALMAKEVGHRGLPDLRVVQTMHERKALMAELSDGFIALPGGFGTFEEFFEVLTWSQLSFHGKPCALLNVAGFFDPLLTFLDHATAEGFVRPAHRELVLAEADLHQLLARMADFQPPAVAKWADRAAL